MFKLFKKKEGVPNGERKLKSASETREYAKRTSVSRNTVLYQIRKSAKELRSYTNICGRLTEELKKELTDAGYKVEEYISANGYYCTEISWKC